MSTPPTLPRMLAAEGPTLIEHHRRFGDLPAVDAEFIAAVEESGLTGRGGGGFPTGRKMAAVTGAKPVVIGNGAEGEPLSRKDFDLLTRAPHLVLDGLAAAAAAIGADKVYLYLHAEAVPSAMAAVEERLAAGVGDDAGERAQRRRRGGMQRGRQRLRQRQNCKGEKR